MFYLMRVFRDILYAIFKCDWPGCTNWVTRDAWVCRDHTDEAILSMYEFEGQHEAYTWLTNNPIGPPLDEADLAGHGLAKELIEAQTVRVRGYSWVDDDSWWA